MTNAAILSTPYFEDSTQVIAKFTVIDTADATLSKLIVSNFPLTPAFNKDSLCYTVNVGCDVKRVEIGAQPTDLQATVSGNLLVQQLAKKKNTFTITVTARDGITTLNYTVIVNRNCDGIEKVTSYELQVTSYKLRVTSYELQVTSYELRVTSYKLRVTSYKLQVTRYIT